MGSAVPMTGLPGGVAGLAPYSSAPGGGVPGEGMQLPPPDLNATREASVEALVPTPPPPPPPPIGSGTAPPRVRAAAATEERDRAQQVGDRFYPLVERVRDSRAGWVGLVVLFGLVVPIVLLRQSFDVRLRIWLAGLTFLVWAALVRSVF